MKVEQEGVEEIRPGRPLYLCRCRLETPSPRGTITKPSCNLVFLHGTCAASSQFGSLLEALSVHVDARCYLYDGLSCGKSPMVKNNWAAYHTDEAVLDLQVLMDTRILNSSLPTVLVGHSYGTTVIIRYIHRYYTPTLNIKGCIFLGAALRPGPLEAFNNSGGHPIMKLPVWILRCLQTTLTEAFLKGAYHKSADPSLVEQNRHACNNNDMYMAKGHHSHHDWASVLEAQTLLKRKIPALVIHGKYDGIIAKEGGRHTADTLNCDFVEVDHAAHQTMEEQPEEVAKAIVNFLSSI